MPAHSYHFSTAVETARPIGLRALHVAREETPGAGTVPAIDLDVAFADGEDSAVYERRVPLIASGSNASFLRLKTKFLDAGIDTHFPVFRAAVPGLVSVYSAHLSRYGAIPGTVAGEPGAVSHLYVAFLDADQLACINASEHVGVNYGLGLIDNLAADLGEGHGLDAVLAYVSKRGAFAPGGSPFRIASFATQGSKLPALGQPEILELARARIAPGDSLENFVHAHVRDDELRQARIELFAGAAKPIGIAGLKWVAGGPGAAEALLPSGF